MNKGIENYALCSKTLQVQHPTITKKVEFADSFTSNPSGLSCTVQLDDFILNSLDHRLDSSSFAIRKMHVGKAKRVPL